MQPMSAGIHGYPPTRPDASSSSAQLSSSTEQKTQPATEVLHSPTRPEASRSSAATLRAYRGPTGAARRNSESSESDVGCARPAAAAPAAWPPGAPSPWALHGRKGGVCVSGDARACLCGGGAGHKGWRALLCRCGLMDTPGTGRYDSRRGGVRQPAPSLLALSGSCKQTPTNTATKTLSPEWPPPAAAPALAVLLS